ncbi:hypothetical protein I8752_03120 [Nostocaceae cyanobacterium CENA369]|uniref:Uncharacterized protein n=1 Tax=Dendronalium phyllosphericum CENA369 TaxID=1725256 RepID=A0A8J7HXJ8_9NOST|nr:hypothetical protein [Dendronalium phyllosphericum]MBH8572039.1 hypothetical protein [Dendronalium phyllosphericum CENA369]
MIGEEVAVLNATSSNWEATVLWRTTLLLGFPNLGGSKPILPEHNPKGKVF